MQYPRRPWSQAFRERLEMRRSSNAAAPALANERPPSRRRGLNKCLPLASLMFFTRPSRFTTNVEPVVTEVACSRLMLSNTINLASIPWGVRKHMASSVPLLDAKRVVHVVQELQLLKGFEGVASYPSPATSTVRSRPTSPSRRSSVATQSAQVGGARPVRSVEGAQTVQFFERYRHNAQWCENNRLRCWGVGLHPLQHFPQPFPKRPRMPWNTTTLSAVPVGCQHRICRVRLAFDTWGRTNVSSPPHITPPVRGVC